MDSHFHQMAPGVVETARKYGAPVQHIDDLTLYRITRPNGRTDSGYYQETQVIWMLENGYKIERTL